MEKISFREFSSMFSKQKPNKIIYTSENQKNFVYEDPLQLKLAFTDMIIMYFPNTIKFSNQSDSLILRWIEYVSVEEKTVIGTEFVIFCNSPVGGQRVRYTFVISY